RADASAEARPTRGLASDGAAGPREIPTPLAAQCRGAGRPRIVESSAFYGADAHSSKERIASTGAQPQSAPGPKALDCGGPASVAGLAAGGSSGAPTARLVSTAG